MSRNLIATEEVRDALGPHGSGRSATWLADDLAVSVATVRRHLNLLIERGWVTKTQMAYGTRNTLFYLTPSGRESYTANDGF